jgi:hypothetical protein
MALAKFDQDPELIGFWGRATVDEPDRHPLLPPH